MEEAEFAREIRAAWSIVDRLGLSRSVTSFVSLGVDETHRRIALNPNSTLEQIYKSGLTRGSFNFLLWDYAYFQFSWSNISGWRLAYWPNPFISGVERSHAELKMLEDQQEKGGISEEDVSSYIDTFPNYSAIPPIRFEFSRDQYVEFTHPAAHFHIGRHFENRWACSILLGPKAFTMLILQLYYPERWRKQSALHGANVPECLDLSYREVIGRTGMSVDITDAERRLFHFGRAIPVSAAG